MMRPHRALTAALGFAAVASLSTAASAHAIGLSRGEYRTTDDGVDVTIVLARAEAALALPSLDPGGTGTVDGAAVAAARGEIERITSEKIRVTSGDARCTAGAVHASLTEQDGLELRAHFTCPRGAARGSVDLALLDDLSHGHRHAAHVVAGAVTAEHLLFRGHATFDIDRTAEASAASPLARFGGFVRMGIEHILTGYDHLLFLFALVLAGGSMRALALAITSFTIAHSLTLAMAVLGVASPPPSLIEPAIALSVAYVGAENFLPRVRARWRITFLFGLLHGFGFAGALAEVAIPRAQVPLALLSFNLGVEIGQLAWMLFLGMLVAPLRRFDWFGRRAVPALSAAVVILGLAWFVGRLENPAIEALGAPAASQGHG
jgi:hydrogenase/urease accessory protein HupE